LGATHPIIARVSVDFCASPRPCRCDFDAATRPQVQTAPKLYR
jgi:hypothetical protein